MRLTELLLFLAPIAAFIAWRLTAGVGGPSRTFVFTTAAALIVLGGMLVWFSHEHALPPGTSYVPAHVEDGRVIQGRGAP